MNGGGLTIDEPSFMGLDVLRPAPPRDATTVDPEDEKRKQVAKDFESVFLHQLLQVMQETIPESDMEDSSSEQIKGMYWSFMAQAIADQGGLGLWKQIYEQMPKDGAAFSVEQPVHQHPRLDESL